MRYNNQRVFLNSAVSTLGITIQPTLYNSMWIVVSIPCNRGEDLLKQRENSAPGQVRRVAFYQSRKSAPDSYDSTETPRALSPLSVSVPF